MPRYLILLQTIAFLISPAYTNTNCNSSQLKSGEADLILKEINEVRKKVRRGEQRNGYTGKNLPAAESLPDLEWSCDLENEAYGYMAGLCDPTATPVDPKGKATIMHSDSEEFFIPRILSSYLSGAEFTALKNVESGSVIYSDADGLAGFANLMRADTTKIGCSRYACKDPQNPTDIVHAMVCFTDQQEIANNDVIYKAITDPNPCPANAYINNTVRRAFLRRHNNLRIQLALGVEVNGKTGKKLSPATKMSQLVYDCGLEKTAYERAKRCENPRRLKAGVKENFFRFTAKPGVSFEKAAGATTQLWWSELNKSLGLDESQHIYYGNQNINSFAKIASDLTTKIGCAIYDCTNVWNVVCHYETTVGHGKSLYTSGTKCKECPHECSVALCKAKTPGAKI